MRKIRPIILLAAVAALFGSCDILDLKPRDRLSEEDVWRDPTLIQLYVNDCYHGILQGFSDSALPFYCDESYGLRNDTQIVLAGSMDQENVTSLSVEINYWGHAYATIRKINNFFERIGDTPCTEEQRELMTGEMKFIRAFIYSELINRYGGVPLITGTYQLHQDYDVRRDTYDDCAGFIECELREAMLMLPDVRPDDEKGRASADACRALLSRVLLYAASPLNNPSNDRAKWQAAADAAGELLDNRYELHPDYRMLFMEDNREIIFARWFSQSTGILINTMWGRGGSDGYGSMNPTQNLVDSYEMAATGMMPFTVVDGIRRVNPASGYDPQNPYEGRDPRFEASILHDGSIWAGRETETWMGGRDSREGIASYRGTYSGYYIKKFIPEELPPTGSSNRPDNPWIYLRYGEILLNYAEALFELGDEERARLYLNRLRGRQSVQMSEVADSGEGLRERIRNERRVEMAFEGRRFFDVRRWKIAGTTEKEPINKIRITKEGERRSYSEEILMNRSFPERQYLVPIPRSEIEKSHGSIEQNPGYN